jgi:hypothetical protein
MQVASRSSSNAVASRNTGAAGQLPSRAVNLPWSASHRLFTYWRCCETPQGSGPRSHSRVTVCRGHPPEQSHVVHCVATHREDLFQIPVGKFVAQVSSGCRENNLRGNRNPANAGLGGAPQMAADVATLLGRTSSQVAPTRAKLIAMGLLYTPEHGYAGFTVPHFDQFMLRAAPSLVVPPRQARNPRN